MGRGLNSKQREELGALSVEISALGEQIDALDSFFKSNAVLRFCGERKTYTKGYMIGAMTCICSTKKVAACSGHAPPGFLKIVATVGFECASLPVSAGAPEEKWMCAAKQIMERHGTHRPKQLIERLFYPAVEGLKVDKGPKITFKVRIEDLGTKKLSEPEEREQAFSNGENAPSCLECQNKLPAMYCQTKCP